MIQGSLSAPEYKHQIIKEYGYNPDIILALNTRFPLAVKQTENVKFSGESLQTKGRAIFNYLRNQVKYRKDDSGRQVIQLPSRLLTDTKKGDCKSLALAAAAFMHNNGFKNVRLRYASYNAADKTPSHVYAVASDNSGSDIIIDPVYHQFNREVPYKHKKDYPMKIEVLSGIPEASVKTAIVRTVRSSDPVKLAKQILLKLQPGSLSFNVVSNYIGRKEGVKFMNYGRDQQLAYQKQLQQRIPTLKNKFIRDLFIMEAKMIQDGIFMGNIFTRRSDSINGIQDEIGKLSLKKIKRKLKKISLKNITKGIKAVGLVVPRKAFLSLVATNFRGLAIRMSKLNDADLESIWVKKFGGKLSVLKNAIASGKKKRPLFGASKKIKSIQGIGYVVDESGSLGAAPGVAAAGIVAAASPILVAIIKKIKSKGIPEVPEAATAGESGDFPESAGLAQDSKPGFLDYVGQALNIAEQTGIIPDKPLKPLEQQIDQALPGDDHTDTASGSSFKLNPLLAAGILAGGAYLILKK